MRIGLNCVVDRKLKIVIFFINIKVLGKIILLIFVLYFSIWVYFKNKILYILFKDYFSNDIL